MRAEFQLAAIIGLGILSRVVHTGWILVDKYAGDALYAAMAYTMITLLASLPLWRKALLAMAIMTALELFQLTMIPAQMLHSPHLAVRTAARLLGTEFSLFDLLAYAVGIGGVCLAELRTPRQIH